jgi:hypothetical protein
VQAPLLDEGAADVVRHERVTESFCREPQRVGLELDLDDRIEADPRTLGALEERSAQWVAQRPAGFGEDERAIGQLGDVDGIV